MEAYSVTLYSLIGLCALIVAAFTAIAVKFTTILRNVLEYLMAEKDKVAYANSVTGRIERDFKKKTKEKDKDKRSHAMFLKSVFSGVASPEALKELGEMSEPLR